MNLTPGDFRVLESSQMLLSKAFSNLFVATEMSPLWRTQNAGSKGQLPLQRESSKQTPLWTWAPVGGVSLTCLVFTHVPLYPVSVLPSLQAQKPLLSPDRSPYAQMGLWGPQIERVWKVSLVQRLSSPLGCVSVWGMTFFPQHPGAQLQMRSSTAKCPDAGTTGKHVSMETPGLPHPTAFRCDWPQKHFFFNIEEVSALSTKPRGFRFFFFFFLVCFWSYSLLSRVSGITSYVWGAFCM